MVTPGRTGASGQTTVPCVDEAEIPRHALGNSAVWLDEDRVIKTGELNVSTLL